MYLTHERDNFICIMIFWMQRPTSCFLSAIEKIILNKLLFINFLKKQAESD